MIRKYVVGTTFGTIAIGSVWYANQDKDAKFITRSKFLGMQRAARAGYVWTKLIVSYKYLSYLRPSEDASEEKKTNYQEKKKRIHERGAQLVLRLCEKNGGLFIKMGQHAASLRPAIPDQYVEVLSELQDRAPERELEEVVLVLEKELDKEVARELIEGMDPKPVGSASLAQVHRCKLKNGKYVAVKVQHAGLEKVVESDLQVIKALDWAATKLFPEDNYSLAWAVREFETNLKQELDFSREAANGTRMRAMIANHPSLRGRVWVPAVDLNRSSRRILTMEFVEGSRIKQATKEDKPFLAKTVVDLFAAMIFTFGFVHCDPHFGNFLIHKDPKTKQVSLALLDHGLYRQLDEKFVVDHAALWRAMVSGDSTQIKKASQTLGTPQYAELFPLMLVNRPGSSQAKLGEAIPKEELREAKKRSGFEAGMSLSQFSQIAEGVPVDMLFVLRTMHLVKDLHRALGGENRDRFLGYAVAAAASPEPVPPPLISSAAWRVFKFNFGFWVNESIIDIKRKFLRYLRPGKGQKESDDSSRFSFSQLFGEKLERNLHKPKLWDRLKRLGKKKIPADDGPHKQGSNVQVSTE